MIPPDVRAVFFDAIGTLIHPEPPAAAVYAAVAQSLGSRLTEAETATRFRTAFAREEALDRANDLRTCEERERRRWRHIVAEVLPDVCDGKRCFEELFAHFGRPDAWRSDATAAVLVELRGVVAGLPELRPLRHLVISSEVGWRKPAPEFFAALCERARLRPGEILFVGDDPVNDYAGATAAGLAATLVGQLVV